MRKELLRHKYSGYGQERKGNSRFSRKHSAKGNNFVSIFPFVCSAKYVWHEAKKERQQSVKKKVG